MYHKINIPLFMRKKERIFMICMQNDAPASGSGRSAGISLAKHLSFTAVLAALCCVSTVFFVVPLPASGYFNMGDVFVLLSGWLLGPLYGAAAAGLGTMLADVVGGYASYAPATLVIKAVMAVAAYFVSRLLKKAIRREKLDVLPRAVSARVGEALMVLGYFFFEGVLLGMGMGAAPNLLGNALQGVCCFLIAVILIGAIYPIKPVRGFFPKLG